MVKTLLKKIIFWPTSPFINHLIGEPIFRFKGRRQAAGKIDLSQVKQVLVVRLDQIGDLVMTSPFLRELRRNLPDAWITLIVLPGTFDLAKNCPYVNEALACDWTGDRDLYRFHRHWRALKFAQKNLQHKQFDLAILPRRDTDQTHGAFLAYLSGAPLRVGYSDITFGPKPPYYRNADRLLTHVLESQELKHEVEYGLGLIHYIGGKVQSDRMEIWLTSDDESFADQVLKSHEVQNDELLIGLAPGAAHPKRKWPLSNFASIGGWLEKEYHARILVVGGQGEEWMAKELRKQLKGAMIDTVGLTSLRQAAAILKRCHLYVGNDSGLMHIAAAACASVVEISCHPRNGLPSHPNSHRRFGPWRVHHRIMQPKKAIPPCLDACMAQEAHCICDITVDQVKEAIVYMLSNQS